MSNIFKNDINKDEIKEKIINFLEEYSIKEEKYFLFNKEIYKKYEYNNKVESFINYNKLLYLKNKQYFLEREMKYNNFITIIRHVCKLVGIPFYKKIKYNKNTYSIEYYIFYSYLN